MWFSSTETFKACFDDKLRGRSFHFYPSLTPGLPRWPACFCSPCIRPSPSQALFTYCSYSWELSFLCNLLTGYILFYLCSIYAFCMCVGACGQGAHSYMCLCMSEIIVNGTSTLLRGRASQPKPELSSMAILTNQLALEVPYLHLMRLVLQGSPPHLTFI